MNFFCSKEFCIPGIPERLDINLPRVFLKLNKFQKDWLSEMNDMYSTALSHIKLQRFSEALDYLHNYLSRLCGIINLNHEHKLEMNSEYIFCVEWQSAWEEKGNTHIITNILIEKSMIIATIGYLYLKIGTDEFSLGKFSTARDIYYKASSCFFYLNDCNEEISKGLHSPKSIENLPCECTTEFSIAFGEYCLAKYGSMRLCITISDEDNEKIKNLTSAEISKKMVCAKISSYVQNKFSKLLSFLDKTSDCMSNFKYLIMYQNESVKIIMYYNFILTINALGTSIGDLDYLIKDIEISLLNLEVDIENFKEILISQRDICKEARRYLSVLNGGDEENEGLLYEIPIINVLPDVPQAELKMNENLKWFPYRPESFL